jgi:hypothetical protein
MSSTAPASAAAAARRTFLAIAEVAAERDRDGGHVRTDSFLPAVRQHFADPRRAVGPLAEDIFEAR